MNYKVIRWVILFWLAGWYIKSAFYVPYLFDEILTYPVHNEYFKGALASPFIAQTAFLLPLLGLYVLYRNKQPLYIFYSVLLSVCSLTLLWHQDTHNDATFVTSFWVALWLLWFSFHLERTDDSFLQQAQKTAQLIIAIIFVGGVVGKLIPQYLSGEVFYNIFVSQNNSPAWVWLKNSLSVHDLKFLLKMISWTVIGIEGLLAVCFIFPFERTRIPIIVLLLTVTLFSTWRILSVVGAFLGLMFALGKETNTKTS